MEEKLLRIKKPDSEPIDISRGDDKTVHIRQGAIDLKLPHGTGQQTLEILAILGGEIESV